MSSALVLLVLTYFPPRIRAAANERYLVESRLNQYVSEYKRAGLDGVRHLAMLRRGRAQQAFFVRVGNAKNETVFLRHADDWAEFHPEGLSRVPAARRRKGAPGKPAGRTAAPSFLLGEERLPDGCVSCRSESRTKN